VAANDRTLQARWRAGAAVTGLLAVAVAAALAGGRPASASASSARDARAQLARAHPTAGQSGKRRPAATDWPSYLNGRRHESYSPGETAITPGKVPDLVRKWHFGSGITFLASPIVASHAVYIGSDAGWFYKLSEKTGKVLARRFIGFQPQIECQPALGVVSTATVAADPVTHNLMVYVAGPDGYLYALRASNLSTKWKAVVAIPSTTQNDYFNYASPTIANGKIYMGVSSNCDTPLVPGGVISYNQATGQKLAQFFTVPNGDVGGSVWSSIGVAKNGDVYATTGNGPDDNELLGQSNSIIKLAPNTLRVLGSFQVPQAQTGFDDDFGASPTFFGNDVGACDKNGIFYTVSQTTMHMRWQKQIGSAPGDVAECIASPVYNGRLLYFGTNQSSYKGVKYPGTVQARNPKTGKLIWETGLPNGIIGSPSMDGGGVIAVGTYDFTSKANATYLLSARTGKILATLVQGWDFSQSAFAYNRLFTANTNGVYAFGLK
jgi:outer membrane protein assembly factor BamB